MNEFIIHPVKLNPEQAVRGTLGVSLREFIEAVVENEGGKYDALYKQKGENTMTTDEIIGRLDGLMHHPDLTDLCEDAEGTRETEQALTAAIQAVERLEEIKQELHGHCEECKHAEKRAYEQPCIGCINCGPFDNHHSPDYWEFRWSLGEEAEQ